MSKYNRVKLLLKDDFTKLEDAKIILLGVGGVGGFCLDCLYRSGVKNITIVDFDTYDETNQNRQMWSELHEDEVKVEALQTHYPEIKIINKETYQSHCIIGNRAYDLNDKRRTDLHLLNNILGGQGLNSRLNLSLREKNGYAYNIESNYSPYFDTGVLSIYFGTDRKNLEKSISLTYKEFDKLKTKKLGEIQLARAKRQITGQLMRSSEINENLMLAIGKSYLVYGKVETPEEINRKIEAITASGLMEIANEILDTDQLSMLAYK